MAKRAALYLRSSKDRHDVSVESQRRELHRYAQEQGDVIVAEFVDKVESAKTANRPAFQDMIAEIKSKNCRFERIYCYDTSRFSRRQYDAQLYKHLLKKHCVELHFLKLPKTDPLMDSVLESLMEIFDEFHSQKSKMDGLRGMRENVQQGWRAGGRAPIGYKLEKIVVGTRDGEPITKSRLVPDPKTFDKIQAYLRGRLNNVARKHLIRELGIKCAETTMIYVEESALTYAGHTVWNRHNECIDGRYIGGSRYRDRKEWVIQRDTHEAMITEEEAETLIA
ncbi:MAG: recombinase family protein, partial [Gammaproteobacteria bacterium]